MSKYNFAFFGTSDFAVIILDELSKAGFIPSIIVTTPDSKKGRGLLLTPSPVKVWAEKNTIPIHSPDSLTAFFFKDIPAPKSLSASGADFSLPSADLSDKGFDFFAVASYGKVIPKSVLDIPKHGVLNVHPSLLPKLRGPSPIETAILGEDKTGVTIMLIDEKVDHGPIIAEKEIDVTSSTELNRAPLDWPPYAEDLEALLAHEGGKLLAEIIPDWVAGKISAKEQEHSKATFTKKINKEDALIDLSDDPALNLRKIRAYHVSPGAYFFVNSNSNDGKSYSNDTNYTRKIRLRIKRAEIKNGELVITRVIPEGKKEMNYEDFLRGLKK